MLTFYQGEISFHIFRCLVFIKVSLNFEHRIALSKFFCIGQCSMILSNVQWNVFVPVHSHTPKLSDSISFAFLKCLLSNTNATFLETATGLFVATFPECTSFGLSKIFATFITGTPPSFPL